MKKVLLFAALLFVASQSSATDYADLAKDKMLLNGKQLEEEEKKPSIYSISNYHINRIVTPFKNPSLKMDMVQGVTHKQKDNVIYLSTTSDRRIAGFITESGSESDSISVVLIPKKLPPQEIIIGERFSRGTTVAKNYERTQPRIDTIKDVLATIAKGDMPKGYIEQRLNSDYLPSCEQDGLAFDFYSGQLLSGGHYMVSIGVVTNISMQTVALLENSCHSAHVVAAASYPSTTLIPNERSEMFVMFERVDERKTYKKRVSLLEQ